MGKSGERSGKLFIVPVNNQQHVMLDFNAKRKANSFAVFHGVVARILLALH